MVHLWPGGRPGWGDIQTDSLELERGKKRLFLVPERKEGIKRMSCSWRDLSSIFCGVWKGGLCDLLGEKPSSLHVFRVQLRLCDFPDGPVHAF